MYQILTRPLLYLIATLVTLAPVMATAEISQKEREITYRQLEVFSNVLSILQDNYVEEIDSNDTINGAIKGMLYNLDPHSAYLEPDDFQELQEETHGEFSGIGIEVTVIDGALTVVSPIEGTPAAKAGLKANDIIVEIDGMKTKEMGSIDAIKELRGPKGSEVNISIMRDEWQEPKQITLKRDLIPLHSVKAFFIAPGIAYTRITNFQSRTTKDYKKEYRKLQEEEHVKGIILDLRNNPGGLLNQAISITDIFIDEGLIVSTRGRTEDQNNSYSAHDKEKVISAPLIVLVNEGSASASEIVAGALQAHKRGIILGTSTFGKGSVQTIIPLPGGAGLRMTTARYYTPDGKSIQALGIQPDVEVPYVAYKEPEYNGSYTREADLPNHIEPEAKEENAKPRDAQDIDIEQILLRDNQIRTALNILKSLDLYSKYSSGN